MKSARKNRKSKKTTVHLESKIKMIEGLSEDFWQEVHARIRAKTAKLTYEGYLDEIHQISKECSGLRRMGSAALDLAYVAAGKLDAFWERNLNLWDMAAGVLLVREAGGIITEPTG